jgi:peptide/nickel transport system substrate-binding protein
MPGTFGRPAASGRAALLALASLAQLCAACGSKPGDAEPATLAVAVPGDVLGIFPEMRLDESFSFDVSSHVFEGLTRLDRELRLRPGLADRWVTPDERTWIFHLRPGVVFSDGSPVRARDVAASLNYLRLARSSLHVLLSALESAEPLSDSEVRLRTRYPFPVLPSHLTQAFVLPEAALAQHPVPPIGTGPYVVESRRPGVALTLAANPRFRGPQPAFARVRFEVLPSGADRVRALEAGQVQIAAVVPIPALAKLRLRPGIRVTVRPGLRVLFLALRREQAPFSDPRVREAFDLALDRDQLIQRALDGFGSPATQLVPSSVLGFDPALRVTRPDPERARALLAQAGRTAGRSVELYGTNNRYQQDAAILAEVARQLGEVGVRVAVKAEPKEVFFPMVTSSPPALSLLGWVCDDLHAGDALATLQSVGLSDPELDRMIDAANRSPTLEERSRLLARALDRVAAERAVLPLVVLPEAYAVSRDVLWEPPLDMALRLTGARRVASPR